MANHEGRDTAITPGGRAPLELGRLLHDIAVRHTGGRFAEAMFAADNRFDGLHAVWQDEWAAIAADVAKAITDTDEGQGF